MAEEVDWSDIGGADDFTRKVEKAIRDRVITRAKKLVGSDNDIDSNAKRLRWIAESSIESPPQEGESGYGVTLDLEKVTRLQPLNRDERIERMAVNREVLEYFYDQYKVDRGNPHTERHVLSNGLVTLQTFFPASGGFVFIEGRGYSSGHNPEDDPLPDYFGVEVYSLVDGKPQGGIPYTPQRKAA